jgi:hypothetical protein
VIACVATISVFTKGRSEARQGTLHRRSYFYAGGTFVQQGSSTLVHGQMYVEHLVPATVTRPFPLVFIEGQGMTGTNLLNTPDGRTGWADYFMSKGYEVCSHYCMMDVQSGTLRYISKLYIVDQPARARSAWLQGVDGTQSVFDVTYVESHFTSMERYNLWPQAHLHTQWPGNGSLGDESFDQFYKSTHPSLNTTLEESNLIKAAGSNLIDTIGARLFFCTLYPQ